MRATEHANLHEHATRLEAPRGRTDEERHYYRLMDKAWRILAPFYDAIVFPLRRLRPRVAQLAGVQPGMRVLDVATGTGAQARAFADAGGEVVGIDLSESMLRIARRKARGRNVTFGVADARALPFATASFDVCSVSFGLHEMPVSVRQDALREMSRVTKPDGKIVIVDYALPKNRLVRALVYHFVKLYERDSYAEFVRSDLGAILEAAGLRTERDTRTSARWWSPLMIVIASKRDR